MDFSLTQLYVVASGNTLPTTGSTQDLTSGQVGIFNPDYTPATAGTIASQKYIYVAQGRNIDIPTLGSIRSDRIYGEDIVWFYKSVAEPIATVQITRANGFSFECDQQITISFRLFSNYINTGFFNGLTRSVISLTPCCNCGTNPCATVSQDTVVQDLVNKINADPYLGKFLVAGMSGTGDTAAINITGKALDKYGNACDPAAFPYEYDRLSFRMFIYAGPETSQDYIVYDRCDIPGTITVLQRATYPAGSSDEITQIEKNYFSYTTTFKHLFHSPLYNQAYVTNVVANTFYDTYVLKFRAHDQNTWTARVPEDETVMFAIPTGTNAGLVTLLTNFAGTPSDYSQTLLTTTTTTSTTSTTTTTTTTLMP